MTSLHPLSPDFIAAPSDECPDCCDAPNGLQCSFCAPDTCAACGTRGSRFNRVAFIHEEAESPLGMSLCIDCGDARRWSEVIANAR